MRAGHKKDIHRPKEIKNVMWTVSSRYNIAVEADIEDAYRERLEDKIKNGHRT